MLQSFRYFVIALTGLMSDGAIQAAEPAAAPVSPRARLEALRGDAPNTTLLLKEIDKADITGILGALETDPKVAGEKYRVLAAAIVLRVRTLQTSGVKHFPPSMGELSLLMLAGLDARLPRDQTAEYDAYGAIHQSYQRMMAEPKAQWGLIKELLIAWMKVRLAGTEQFPFMAVQFNLRELAPDLVAVALDTKADGKLRYHSLWVLAVLGGKPEMVLLAPALDDATLVPIKLQPDQRFTGPAQERQQFRDIVLGVLIQNVGEKMEPYGFSQPNNYTMPVAPNLDFVFRDDATRQRALAMWKARSKK